MLTQTNHRETYRFVPSTSTPVSPERVAELLRIVERDLGHHVVAGGRQTHPRDLGSRGEEGRHGIPVARLKPKSQQGEEPEAHSPRIGQQLLTVQHLMPELHWHSFRHRCQT